MLNELLGNPLHNVPNVGAFSLSKIILQKPLFANLSISMSLCGLLFNPVRSSVDSRMNPGLSALHRRSYLQLMTRRMD